MSMIYDNWERLVAAVVKREEIRQLCRQPSLSSESSSDCSSSFRLSDVNKDESVVPNLYFLAGSAFYSSYGFPVPNSLIATKGLVQGASGVSIITELLQDVNLPDQEFLAKGTQLMMKKLVKKVKVTAEEFKHQMMVLGNCSHENVAAPRAYYFNKREPNRKFIFYDYHSQGSVSDMLHEKKNYLDKIWWGSRLKIAIGTARGIAHIHRQCGGKMVHGNIKSSNIFLNSKQYGYVSDLCLPHMVKPRTGWLYKFKNASQEDDVYSFGILLLELLTGKSPMENQHIFTPARSKEWTSRLFDQSLRGGLLVDEGDMVDFLLERVVIGEGTTTHLLGAGAVGATLSSYFHSMELEMEEMLQVAKRCLAVLPQDRPKMFELVLMFENIATTQRARKLVTEGSN